MEHIKPKIFERSPEGIARSLASGKLKNIVVIIGAGISRDAGIPDFRSPGGLYDKIISNGFPIPEEFLTRKMFQKDPARWYHITKSVSNETVNKASPTNAHKFLKFLESRGALLRVYTQNIDGLEHKSGVSYEKIVNVHGSSLLSRCDNCKIKEPNPIMKDIPLQMKENIELVSVPICPKCSNIMRPDVVFFEEQIRLENGRMKDFKECGGIFVLGSSLKVYPVADFVNKVKLSIPRILIDLNTIEWPNLRGHEANKFRFHGNPIRDVMLIGDVQEITSRIMESVLKLEEANEDALSKDIEKLVVS